MFDSPVSEIGISPELSIHVMYMIQKIEENY